jgi:Leucine-rich repeat (LRR) protein
MESRNRVQITFIGDSEHEDEDFSKFLLDNIKANHLVIFGMNVSWIGDAEIINSLYSLLNIVHVLDRHVYFVIEEECNWRVPPIVNNIVLPITHQPISQESGMTEFIRNLSAIVEPMQKYLLPKHSSADRSVIEERIREARKTKELNLSGLSLTEIPAAVFQIEGLVSLDLSNNIIAELPEDIEQLHTLRSVNLSRNPIESLPDDIILLQLEELDIRETKVNRLPIKIGQLRNLRTLRIDHTQIRVLPISAFLNGFPREFTYEGLNLLNINTASGTPASLTEYLKPFHTKEFAVLEIHSESAKPHFDTVPNDVVDKVHYCFYSQLNTLQELFKVIYTEAGTKHTIVYLCDEKNILSPQFGNIYNRYSIIYQYWRDFGKPLNLIINNEAMNGSANPDLIDSGKLNFVAVRNDKHVKGDSFPDLFFKTIWQNSDNGQITGILIAAAAQGAVKEERYLRKELQNAGYPVRTMGYTVAGRDASPQINKTIADVDLAIFIINDSAGIDERSIRRVKDHYNAATQLKKRILLLLHKDLSASSDRLVAEFINMGNASSVIDIYRNEKDILEKTYKAIAHFKEQKHSDQRMSLANTLKYIEQEAKSNNMETGYDVYVNYEKLIDFSLPLGKKSSGNRPAPKTLNKSAPKTINNPAPTPTRRKQKPKMKPFNGQWVLVVGSGNEHLKQSERLSALAVGNMLAKEGYGLICGGWPGVDHFVSQAFQEVYDAYKKPVKTSLLQLLNPGQKANTGGKHMVLKTTEWNEYALKKAMAVVVIGGASLPISTYESARQKQIPVIPIPGTHKAAAEIYAKLKNDTHHLYTIELLQSMEELLIPKRRLKRPLL